MPTKKDRRSAVDASVNWEGVARLLGYRADEVEKVRRLVLPPMTSDVPTKR